ncbi:MAG: hypothetical protein LBR12_04150, partial [Opitutaceae bacterium]|nr:hypothetical protein [Opitutaceae bacterium]
MKFQKNSVIFRVPVAPRVFTRASQKILCVLCVSVVNLLFAAGADDLAPRLSGAAYSLDIGQNTSTYLFHADHTWEEHYKFAVKAGAWRQTAPDTFSIGAYTFTLAPDTSALRRSDNKIWRRAAPAPVAVADPAAPNLIPATPSHASPNYWGTWWSQVDGKRDPALRSLISAATANAPSFDGDQGDPSQRDGLNEKLLFHDAPFPPNPASPSGWVSDFAAARADLF